MAGDEGGEVGEGGPVEFEEFGVGFAAGGFVVAPAVGGAVVGSEVEEVAGVGFVSAEGGHVVVDGAEGGDEGEVGEAGFFAGFAEDGLGGGFAGVDGAAGDLDAGLGLVDVGEDEEVVVAGDVGEGLVEVAMGGGWHAISLRRIVLGRGVIHWEMG